MKHSETQFHSLLKHSNSKFHRDRTLIEYSVNPPLQKEIAKQNLICGSVNYPPVYPPPLATASFSILPQFQSSLPPVYAFHSPKPRHNKIHPLPCGKMERMEPIFFKPSIFRTYREVLEKHRSLRSTRPGEVVRMPALIRFIPTGEFSPNGFPVPPVL